ncbi:peptide chain release factor N(5)-glutamine methyltransferase [Candidatus Babeliales bacterium]|nr:peptide chain release factor N(5)-glutamine methyltransferase [Candidatus Babeliales bacterium]
MHNVPVRQIIAKLTQLLVAGGLLPHDAQQEAWWLLEKLVNQSQTNLIAQGSVGWDSTREERIAGWIHQRTHDKKPLQYILGSVPFADLEILVEPPILIPRPETEEIVVWLIDAMRASGRVDWRILDLCTGTGCIALGLAAAFPNAFVIGIDKNPHAVDLAKRNARHNKLEHVLFIESDLFENLDPSLRFDLIISNPPYISNESYQQLSKEVVAWEDKLALVAARDGMALYERIVAKAPAFLVKLKSKNVPQLVFEIGKDQDSIEEVMKNGGFQEVTVYHDLRGLRRWATAVI